MFQNIYTQRKVAETSARPCDICYKPSTIVLTTSENTDFFYVCASHLKDKGFCSPIVDPATVAADKKKRELEAEIEKLKKEFEEKQAKKKEKEKGKEKEKDKKGDAAKQDNKDVKSVEKDQPISASNPSPGEDLVPQPDAEPRVFALQRTFYQQRLDKKRNVEMAKRNLERLQNPSFFPAVPKGFP